jgi:glyoxylase-like metal-dependent hydrolase (beta-lactamase superfamily II)
VAKLEALGVSDIDVVAITHGHADHIGQLDEVLASISVQEPGCRGAPHTFRTFEAAIAALRSVRGSLRGTPGRKTTPGRVSSGRRGSPAQLGGEGRFQPWLHPMWGLRRRTAWLGRPDRDLHQQLRRVPA